MRFQQNAAMAMTTAVSMTRLKIKYRCQRDNTRKTTVSIQSTTTMAARATKSMEPGIENLNP